MFTGGDRYIDLDRGSLEFSSEEEAEQAAIRSYTATFFGKDEHDGWDVLLKHPRVVVLGEPGSGRRENWKRRPTD